MEEEKMAKISKKTIENMRDILDRGCDYAATQEVVKEIADETLKELGCELCQSDDATVNDWDGDEVCTLYDYANIFWDNAVEKFLNILITEE
jgi:hypothetical protein